MNEYYIENDGDIVVMIKENHIGDEAICIIANLSLKNKPLSKPIELPGIHVQSDVWYQTDYQMYQGFIT